MAMTMLDHEGVLIEHKFYPLDTATSKFNNDNLTFLNDSTLLNVANTVSTGSNQAQILVWLNQFGDTLRTSPHVSFFYGQEPINQWDNPSSYLTRRTLVDNTGNIYELPMVRFNSQQIRKFDAEGNLIWEYILDEEGLHDGIWGNSMKIHNGNLIVPIFNSGFLGEEDYRTYIYTFSLDGELENEVLFDDFNVLVEEFMMDENDNLIIAAHRYVDGSYPYLVKVTTEGEVIWELAFDDDSSGFQQEFKDLVDLGNGEYVAGGTTFDDNPEDEDVNGLYDYYALLAKFTEDGEVLWERRFTGVHSKGDQHRLIDIKPTSDGGFVFCGESRDSWPNSDTYEAPGQRAWVVKTDEYGCIVPGCQFVGIEEEEQTAEYFIAGPNPVSHTLNLYAGPTVPRCAEIVITDARGAIVESFLCTAGSVNYMIETSGWASGTYAVLLRKGAKVLQSAKVVKV